MQKIKQLRKDWNIFTKRTGEKNDLSFQQIRKYEKGMDSIYAGQLLQIGKALNIPLAFFISDEDEVSVVSSSD